MSTRIACMPTNVDYTQPILSADWFTKIIKSVNRPLSVFVLLVLVCFVAFVQTTAVGEQMELKKWILGLLALIVLAFVGLLAGYRDVFNDKLDPPDPPDVFVKTNPEKVPEEWQNIYGADRPAPPINTWDRQLRPSLYQ